jgi:hypothetical protein
VLQSPLSVPVPTAIPSLLVDIPERLLRAPSRGQSLSHPSDLHRADRAAESATTPLDLPYRRWLQWSGNL